MKRERPRSGCGSSAQGARRKWWRLRRKVQGGDIFARWKLFVFREKASQEPGLESSTRFLRSGGHRANLIVDVDSPVSIFAGRKADRFRAAIGLQRRTSSLMAANADGTAEHAIAVLHQPLRFRLTDPRGRPTATNRDRQVIKRGIISDIFLETVAVDTGAETRLGSRRLGLPAPN